MAKSVIGEYICGHPPTVGDMLLFAAIFFSEKCKSLLRSLADLHKFNVNFGVRCSLIVINYLLLRNVSVKLLLSR